MYKELNEINDKPTVFGVYTAEALWADEHRSRQMLEFHLNETVDIASRKRAFIEASSEWIIDHFDLQPGKSVCDFGCGPGLYTSRFEKSGANVTGLDFSATSIRYARQQAQQSGQKIEYLQGNYLAFDQTDQFDLITMIMCDFCALSPAQRSDLRRIFHKALKANGAVLLDVYSMAAFAERKSASFYERNQLNHFWAASDYYCFVNTFKYEQEAVMLDKYSIFPERGRPEVIYNWLQYFSPDSLTRELEMAGLSVGHIYKDIRGSPYSEQHSEFAVIARKTT